MYRFFLFLALIALAPLSASLDADVPELPSIGNLGYKIFKDAPWALFLHHWDSLITSTAIAAGMIWVFSIGLRQAKLIPSGLQNFLEWLVENMQKAIVEVLGKDGLKYLPFLGTLFIYILAMNWLVLIPFMKPPTANVNITAALAICVFCLVQYQNIKNYGLFGFIYHMAGSPKDLLGWAMSPLMFCIELLTQFTRPITLSFRLFGNVVGEDILIGAFALFGVMMLSSFDAPIGFPLQIPFLFLAMLTGLMQALVFTLLSTIYILLSIPEAGEHH